MRTRAATTLLALALTTLAAAPAAAADPPSGSFTAVTYNVAGLPEPLSGGEPETNTTPIGERLNAYDVVNVQEDFNYHDRLYAADRHPYRTATSGPVPFGSGLNTMSRIPLADVERVTWSRCNGTDCLTPKGFSVQRLRLAEGAFLDLYNVHANAGSTEADLAARRANLAQLAAYVTAHSAGNAVLVMGDTNTRYTRAGDTIAEFVAATGTTDAWVALERGGVPPRLGDPALVCDDAAVTDACEVVDKILFRSSRLIRLEVSDYRNADADFRTADDRMLSDHYPIAARVSWSLAPGLAPTDPFGGPGGTPFTDAAAAGPLRSVAVRAGSRVDAVAVTTAAGATLRHGGTGGTERVLTLAAGERVTGVTVHRGRPFLRSERVSGVTLRTSAGRELTAGTTTADRVSWTAPAGYGLGGFAGRAGSEVDRLGVIWVAG